MSRSGSTLTLSLCGIALVAVAGCGVTVGSRPTTASTATATTTTATPVLPGDLAGENGQVAFNELKKAGFKSPIFQSDNGKAVLLFSDWTVVSAKVEHGTAVVMVKK